MTAEKADLEGKVSEEEGKEGKGKSKHWKLGTYINKRVLQKQTSHKPHPKIKGLTS